MPPLPPIPPNVQTPADEARAYLDRAQHRLGQLPGSKAEALDILRDLDRAAKSINELEERGAPFLAEHGRLEDLHQGIRNRAERILDEIGLSAFRQARAKAFAEPNASRYPPGPWWNLESIVGARRRARLKRFGLAMVFVVLLGGVLWFLNSPLGPGDPTIRAAYNSMTSGQTALEDGDLDRAAVDFTQVTQVQPKDPSAWLLLGVVRLRQGRTREADSAFKTAQALYPDPASFYTERSSVLATSGLAEQAAADAEMAVRLAPNNTRAYFVLGNAREIQGRTQDALDAYQKAADLAQAAGDSTMVALARLRIGYLLQRLQPPGT